ncbi:hypothetical protein PF005_g26921 [Phytophthora fragariae]|uniref:Uncharacterized protein n=1 Tax=Phytophthora fragariae TaxID=53985 RepID=A0A6A4BKF6_9STRA|nr:hypothetical protein PF011_g25925 [Phytophthora fragariae]KAE9067937.1 hypothetical protein PF010_g27271 [Phytophthora fragariae]KAE9171977.1 hypothetical protein PF005_g26921 [Phytophthora fragariae]KAE9273835.1 hypothetical protein PF001_g27329 [Phytophthora fragariae]
MLQVASNAHPALKQRQVLKQKLTLRSAAELPFSDFSVAGGKIDLYASLKLNGTKPRRPCLKNTFNPVRDTPEHYMYEYIFYARDAASSALNVEACELDTLNSCDLLVAPVAKLADGMDMSTLEFGGHEWAAVNELCQVVG